MKILGIETSCDETSASIVENGTKILSNIITSSQEIHAKTGGIIPENAARQQVISMIPVLENALQDKSFDSIAVTVGPGLIGSLLVGVETAKTISYIYKKPITPINHLVAHIYANFLDSKNPPSFPAICLVVSGGHTDLVFLTKHGHIKHLGTTRDDAAGEAFDKIARLLNLPYPGGPSISEAAEKYKEKDLTLFPRPMIKDKSYDFSFSGLKTAVLKEVKKDIISDNLKLKYSAEVQEAIIDVLVSKTLRAVKEYKPKSLLLAGGVSANKRLREKVISKIEKDNIKIKIYMPKPNLCTDNAASIASCAFFNKKNVNWKKIDVNPELTIAEKV